MKLVRTFLVKSYPMVNVVCNFSGRQDIQTTSAKFKTVVNVHGLCFV